MSSSKELSSAEMDPAIQAFQDWRSNRKKMCRIPDRLWKIAAKLSPQYPISTICENLGLNWGTLKKKINHYSLSTQTTQPVPPVPPKSSLQELFKTFLGNSKRWDSVLAGKTNDSNHTTHENIFMHSPYRFSQRYRWLITGLSCRFR